MYSSFGSFTPGKIANAARMRVGPRRLIAMNDLVPFPPATGSLASLRFDTRFVRELPADPLVGPQRRQVHGALYSWVNPEPVSAPRLIAYSPEVAALLGIDEAAIASPEFTQVFGGNALVEGMQPYAANYGGH